MSQVPKLAKVGTDNLPAHRSRSRLWLGGQASTGRGFTQVEEEMAGKTLRNNSDTDPTSQLKKDVTYKQ